MRMILDLSLTWSDKRREPKEAACGLQNIIQGIVYVCLGFAAENRTQMFCEVVLKNDENL